MIECLTDDELVLRFEELHAELPDGGCFGWDWPTLRAVLPEQAARLAVLRREVQRRLKECGVFAGLRC